MGQHIGFLVFIAYAQMLMAHVSSKARSLNSVLSLNLHPYSVYVSTEGSGECSTIEDSPGSSMLTDAIITKTSCTSLLEKKASQILVTVK